tara:strand:- start:109 stop:561 length:453 start_codon:yes stop_codon:yes gene_type:complete
MKKIIPLVIILSITFFSCEKDDICIDDTTPNLIIKFNNDTIQTEKKLVPSLTVWVEGKDSLYVNKSLDSIVIPLDLTQNNTLYNFSSNDIVDQINFSFNRKDTFVSRSCGYKTIFENLQIESATSLWIKNITITNSTIENETAAHITIFH